MLLRYSTVDMKTDAHTNTVYATLIDVFVPERLQLGWKERTEAMVRVDLSDGQSHIFGLDLRSRWSPQ